MELVTIHWHGPYRVDNLALHDITLETGIYAISRIFGGRESLLYIGQTLRDFEKRIGEHRRDWLNFERGQILIRCGTLEFESGRRYSKRKLNDVESLLIQWHKPPRNTRDMKWYRGREFLSVLNSGRRGLLDHHVSAEELEWS